MPVLSADIHKLKLPETPENAQNAKKMSGFPQVIKKELPKYRI